MKSNLYLLLDAILAFAIGLTPAALGAAVSLAYERGLTWSQRFVQLAIGVIVSHFATGFVAAIAPRIGLGTLDTFVLQSVGFVTGMIAYKATPRFTAAATDVAAGVPARLVDRFLSMLPGKEKP